MPEKASSEYNLPHTIKDVVNEYIKINSYNTALVHSCQGQMFHGSEICWALTLVTDTSSTSSLININLLHRTCHAYNYYILALYTYPAHAHYAWLND